MQGVRMSETVFSIITTAKNEDAGMIKKVFENWDLAVELFEMENGLNNSVEVIIADAGGNGRFPKLSNCRQKLITEKKYERVRRRLYNDGIIKQPDWDSQSIGRSIGFSKGRPKGKLIVFQDIDSMFSTGIEWDYNYVAPTDSYDNYFTVMCDAFASKPIMAAAPSMRAFDSDNRNRRLAAKWQNMCTWLSTKTPTVYSAGYYVLGPSLPGFSIVVRKETVAQLIKDLKDSGQAFGPYDPEVAIAEDYKFSRTIGKYGRASYEREAGVFTRTLNRVGDSYVLLRAMAYLLLWIPHYVFPGHVKYKRHTLSI